MTSGFSIDLKEVIFINPRCEKDFESLPPEVKETADGAIDALQNGRPLVGQVFGPLVNDRTLAGISEIKMPYGGDAYRVYVWLGCPQAVFVLDAGEKKSPSGRDIPQWQKQRLAERLSAAKAWSRGNAAALEQEFERRAARRAAFKEGSRDDE